MPVHTFARPKGRLVEIEIDSELLRDNFLGDPSRRTVAVYLPPGYDDSSLRYPLFVDLAGFTGSGLKRLAWTAFGEAVPARVDRLVDEGRMGPVIIAFPDCFTSLGGNQYIDSTVMGPWASFLTRELVPRLDGEFRTLAGRDHRALYGKSSGGYGALVHGMQHADVWGAVASHSGDVGFDLVYRRDFPVCVDALARHGLDIPRFLAHIRQAPKISGAELHTLMSLAMAATYDPRPAAPAGIRLPVDLETYDLDEAAWARWLAHDPLYMIENDTSAAALRSLRGLFIDCGSRDQYAMHFGNRAFVRKLRERDVEHTYEEFDDDHSGIDYRLDRSLPFLYRALVGAP